MNEAVRGRGSGFKVLAIWGLKSMLDFWECGHIERYLSSTCPKLFNGCLIVKRLLSIQNAVRGMFTGHGGHGNALLFLRGLA